MSFYSISEFIRTNYPEYWGRQTYPSTECVRIHKVDEEWGIFSNFGHTPIVVDSLTFDTSERLFQLMKFRDEKPVWDIYNKQGNPKMTAKKWEKTYRRKDWGIYMVETTLFQNILLRSFILPIGIANVQHKLACLQIVIPQTVLLNQVVFNWIWTVFPYRSHLTKDRLHTILHANSHFTNFILCYPDVPPFGNIAL